MIYILFRDASLMEIGEWRKEAGQVGYTRMNMSRQLVMPLCHPLCE